ncbi:aldo/keto reductase [Arthrobacter sp. MMS18-M83]|nr:aldo/keto reductase [Arthrobacter sp. MMS18-M83]WAH97252.1 aldo/keto reductase [Arthrobacter sp. MMS18-M83]
MKQRILGRTGRAVSLVGLGPWQLGADWGNVDPNEARDILEAAVNSGVTFLDTADVYGDGRSEQTIGAYLAANPGLDIMVATKIGRRQEQTPENYTLANSGSGLTVPGGTSRRIDFEQGFKAVDEFRKLVPSGATTAQTAVAWIAAQEGVSTVIPGARNGEQARSNAASAEMLDHIDPDFENSVREIYDRYFRETIHSRW